MTDDSDDAAEGRRLKSIVDILDDAELGGGAFMRDGRVSIGRTLTRAAARPSAAARLQLAVADACLARQLLIDGRAPGEAARYLAGALYNRRPPPGVRVPLEQFGGRIELSGRTLGGVYFRVVGISRTALETPAGRIEWIGSITQWVRLARQLEEVLIP